MRALSQAGVAVAFVTLPGCLAFALWLVAGVRTACAGALGRPIAAGEPSCFAPLAYLVAHPTGWWEFDHVFGPIVLMLAVTLSILSAAHLAIRLRRGLRAQEPSYPR